MCSSSSSVIDQTLKLGLYLFVFLKVYFILLKYLTIYSLCLALVVQDRLTSVVNSPCEWQNVLHVLCKASLCCSAWNWLGGGLGIP